MKIQLTLRLLTLLLLFAGLSHAQDNNAVKINDKLSVSGGERSDFIFNRALLIGQVDSVPFDLSRSGVYSLGFGYGFPIGKTVEIKLEPRATWHKLYFPKTNEKWFPAPGGDSALVYQKIRSFYIELPVGIKLKLLRNDEQKYKMLVEAGFSFGYNTGSAFKVRRETDLDGDGDYDTRTTTKVHRVPELNKLRYGPYFRFGTNWISFYGFYRMTELFDPDEKFGDAPDGTGGRAYPKFPQIELGFSITI